MQQIFPGHLYTKKCLDARITIVKAIYVILAPHEPYGLIVKRYKHK